MKLKVAALLAGLILTPSVLADAEAQAKYRHDLYEAMGGHMGSIVVILKNQIYTEDLVVHANAIAALSDITPKIFPEGSLTEKSEALPAIWEEPEAFNEAMTRFQEAAQGMAAAAATGDMAQIGGAVQTLGGSCKGCHDDFRKE